MDKQKRGLKRCRRMIMMDITSGNAHNHKIKSADRLRQFALFIRYVKPNAELRLIT